MVDCQPLWVAIDFQSHVTLPLIAIAIVLKTVVKFIGP